MIPFYVYTDNKVSDKWMQVEVIMLKEVSQTQKDKSCMISFICASHTKNNKCHNYIFVHVQIYSSIYQSMHPYTR
jgi:hypothetical protein